MTRSIYHLNYNNDKLKEKIAQTLARVYVNVLASVIVAVFHTLNSHLRSIYTDLCH